MRNLLPPHLFPPPSFLCASIFALFLQSRGALVSNFFPSHEFPPKFSKSCTAVQGIGVISSLFFDPVSDGVLLEDEKALSFFFGRRV